MTKEHEWESIKSYADAGDYVRTQRMRVPGGWLYLHHERFGAGYGEDSYGVMAFVPDPPAEAKPSTPVEKPVAKRLPKRRKVVRLKARPSTGSASTR